MSKSPTHPRGVPTAISADLTRPRPSRSALSSSLWVPRSSAVSAGLLRRVSMR